MALTPVFIFIVIGFAFSMIDNCLPMVIPSSSPTTIFSSNIIRNKTTSRPTHILRVHIRVRNSLIETLVNQKQLDLIEIRLQQQRIPYRQIQDNKDGITIIIGPFQKYRNLTATMLMLNQSRFHTNFTKLIPIKADYKNQTKQFPMSVQATEYNLALDQESDEFRHCLEKCEIHQGNELKPDHNCIRKKCLKEITGI